MQPIKNYVQAFYAVVVHDDACADNRSKVLAITDRFLAPFHVLRTRLLGVDLKCFNLNVRSLQLLNDNLYCKIGAIHINWGEISNVAFMTHEYIPVLISIAVLLPLQLEGRRTKVVAMCVMNAVIRLFFHMQFSGRMTLKKYRTAEKSWLWPQSYIGRLSIYITALMNVLPAFIMGTALRIVLFITDSTFRHQLHQIATHI